MANINLNSFIGHFAAQFENTDLSTINAETVFRELEEWDSLIALSLIAMADEEYQIKLTGDDIRTSTTVADLFEKVKAKAL
jgi:acyl carrier protein